MRAFDTKAFDPAISWAKKHERQISALSLAGGFAFDSVTFGQIDHAITQAVFIVYLLVAGWRRSFPSCRSISPRSDRWASVTARSSCKMTSP
jgi:hypothetical protein